MPGDAAGVAISNGDRRLAVTTLAWIDRCAFRPEYRAADRNSANNAEITSGDGPAASAARKQIVNDVATLRHGGEMKSYIDLLFLTLIVVLCISKIVTN